MNPCRRAAFTAIALCLALRYVPLEAVDAQTPPKPVNATPGGSKYITPKGFAVTVSAGDPKPSPLAVNTAATAALQATLEVGTVVPQGGTTWTWSTPQVFFKTVRTDPWPATPQAIAATVTGNTDTPKQSARTLNLAGAPNAGYYLVTATVTATLTDNTNAVDGAQNTVSVIFAVGTQDFSISVTPVDPTIAAGTGGCVLISVTPVGTFTGSVTLALDGIQSAIPGVTFSHACPLDIQKYPGPPAPLVVNYCLFQQSSGSMSQAASGNSISVGAPSSVTLELCVGSGVPASNGLTPPCYSFTVLGTATMGKLASGAASPRMHHAVPVNLSVASAVVRPIGPPEGNPQNDGIFRRVWSKAGFSGISADVTFPATDPSKANLSACWVQDTFVIYSGGADNGEGIDIGFQLAHTGNAGWLFTYQDKDADKASNQNGTPLFVHADGTDYGGTPSMLVNPGVHAVRFEAPGYHRQPGVDPALPMGTPLVDVNGIVQPPYVILAVDGVGAAPHTEEVYLHTKDWKGGGQVKRVNAIGQTVKNKDHPGALQGNGPGKGFYMSGSQLLGGAWNNVKVYPPGQTGRPFGVADADPTTPMTYPGSPFVSFIAVDNNNQPTSYHDETKINLSTIPMKS